MRSAGARITGGSVEWHGAPRRPVATEVEPHLHHALRRSVQRWKRPFLGRLDGGSLEIAARTGPIHDGGEHRTVLVDDDPHPYLDVSADRSTGAPRNIRHFLVERRWSGGPLAPTLPCGRHRRDRRPHLGCRSLVSAGSL